MVDTTGWSVRNKANPYFAKANHVKLAKNQATKRFLDSVVDQFLVVRALLFSDNEPGFFYDFDDWSTLFQDTAGTQPVTAANQGVALALDKRLGLKLGPELVTSLAFPLIANSGGSSGAFSAGVFSNSAAGSSTLFPAFAHETQLTRGRIYQVEFEFSGNLSRINRVNFDAGNATASVDRGNITGAEIVAAGGKISRRVHLIASAISSDVNCRFTVWTDGTSTWSDLSINSISVRELKGNHATQATTAARPRTVIHPDGGVRNLLDRSEEFDNAVWGKQPSTTITPNVALAPDGTMTADRVVNLDAALGDRINQNITIENQTLVGSVWLRGEGSDIGKNVEIAVKRTGGSFAGASINHTLTSEWVRVEASFAQISGNTGAGLNIVSPASNSATNVLIWGAQLELGSTATPYQKRVNFLDVTEAGKRSIRRLYFNGTSHFMTTPTITPNTDKAQVFAGVRKLSDVVGTIIETSVSFGGNNGTVGLFTPGAPGDADLFVSRGTIIQTTRRSHVFPFSGVYTGTADIGGQSILGRSNGTDYTIVSGTDQGTGNYLAYPAYIGARAGTSLFFNGYLDQLITRFGTNLDSGAIETTEKYVSTKVPEVTL
jgi:hypothetical protein